MNKKIISIIIFCICFFSVSSIHAEENKLVKLNNVQLQKVIDSNKGKVILINFFATWCPPCREEIPQLISLVKHYKDSEVMFIGISLDRDISLVKPFMEKLLINYPVYLADNDIALIYGIRSIPHNAVYDTQGILVANMAGYLAQEDIKRFIDNILEGKK